MKAQAVSLQLTQLERILLLVPLAGGFVFGLFPFLLGGLFGQVGGFPGNDSYIYRLAGAATFGYAVGLFMGIRGGGWQPIRLVVIGTLVFNLASIFACSSYILGGGTDAIGYVILLASITISVITGWLLYSHRVDPIPPRDISQFDTIFATLAAIASGLFAFIGLFLPVVGSQLLGFKGTDVLLIQQAGAATLGYVAMAVMGLMSGAWTETRLPTVMALVFNGLAFIASVVAILAAEPLFITLFIGAASLFFAVASLAGLRRHGAM